MSDPKKQQEEEKILQEKRLRRRFLSIGLLIGMIIGVPIVLYFVWLGADEVGSFILGITLLLIFVGIQLFFLIRYRDKILSIIFGKIKANNEILVDLAVNAVDAISSEEQDKEAFKENSTLLIKGIVARYSWLRFRGWMFSTAIVLLGGFAGLLGSVLLFKQIERLDTQNMHLARQDSLIQAQGNYLIELNKPVVDVKSTLHSSILLGDSIEQQFGIKIYNFGQRPAHNITIELEVIEYDSNQDVFHVRDYFKNTFVNTLPGDNYWDMGRKFKIKNSINSLYTICNIEYMDIINNKISQSTLYYKIPKESDLYDKNQVHGLFNIDSSEKELIQNHLSRE